MTKAGKLVAIAILGMTLCSGAALAQLLPPLPPMPALPPAPSVGVPALPALPPPPSAPSVQYQACVTAVDRVFGPTTTELTVMRDGTVVYLNHRSGEAAVFLDEAIIVLGLDTTTYAILATMEDSVWVTNYTLQNVTLAVNYTRDASQPAVDDILNGTADILDHSIEGPPRLVNATIKWANLTFARDFGWLATWEQATKLSNLGSQTVLLVNAYPAFVLAGPPVPLAALNNNITGIYAGMARVQRGAEAMPGIAEDGLDLMSKNMLGFAEQLTGLATLPTPPGDVVGVVVTYRDGTAANAQQEARTTSGRAVALAGATPGRAQAAIGQLGGCAEMLLDSL